MSTAAMARLCDVRFGYGDGDFELHVAELSVLRGESVAIIGPSGSGKTTLLNLIAGIAVPRTGSVRTDGVEITALDEARRREFRIGRIGLVFQEFELLDYLSVLDNILLPYRISSALQLDESVWERARSLAAATGVAEKLARNVRSLSQGERQRVAVCRALIAQPALLLADEPTGNLDPRNKERVLDILFEAARASGATLITVTHDRELLERFGRVVDFRATVGGKPLS